MLHDGLGRRIRKAVSGGGLERNDELDGTTDYFYAPGTSQCIEERDADAGDRVLRQYVWGLYVDELIQQREFPYEDLPERSCDYYPLSDLHYRTVALSDAAGCIAEAYDTDAYGRTLVSRDCRDGAFFTPYDRTQKKVGEAGGEDVLANFAPTCPFIFTGRRLDAETQLYFYRARYYDPDLGRFLSRDPLDYEDGMNLYEYVGGMPNEAVDPEGEALFLIPVAVLVVGGSGVGAAHYGAREMELAVTEGDWDRFERGQRFVFGGTVAVGAAAGIGLAPVAAGLGTGGAAALGLTKGSLGYGAALLAIGGAAEGIIGGGVGAATSYAGGADAGEIAWATVEGVAWGAVAGAAFGGVFGVAGFGLRQGVKRYYGHHVLMQQVRGAASRRSLGVGQRVSPDDEAGLPAA